MKTKIIYISGSEVFEMADVRAAFDEVRTTLGLGRDTILFGVPVDNDDALATAQSANTTVMASIDPAPNISMPELESNTVTEAPAIPQTEHTPQATQDQTDIKEEDSIEEPVAAPVLDTAPIKKSRGRPRKALAPESKTTENITDEEIVAPQSEKVSPILSVLAAKAPEIEENKEFVPAPVEDAVDIIAATTVSEETQEPVSVETVSIDDMIADDAPSAPIEKTLEQLLESMTPLGEDHGDNEIIDVADDEDDIIDIASSDLSTTANDADATLEQLAAEFANTEDQIATPAPTQTHGKIGKLKNILPFKKARRDDTGLMGDLFGWAGVAANDEDFAIPGFFPTAAKK